MRLGRVIRMVVVVALVVTSGVATVVRPTPTTAAPGEWSTVPAMSMARAGHSTTVLDGYVCTQTPRPAECGMVLVAGGRIPASGGTAVTNSAELYGPAEATWGSLPPMAIARTGHRALMRDGGAVAAVVGVVPIGPWAVRRPRSSEVAT